MASWWKIILTLVSVPILGIVGEEKCGEEVVCVHDMKCCDKETSYPYCCTPIEYQTKTAGDDNSIGAILGGTFGGIAIVAIGVFVCFKCYTSRRKAGEEAKGAALDTSVNPDGTFLCPDCCIEKKGPPIQYGSMELCYRCYTRRTGCFPKGNVDDVERQETLD